MAEWFDRVGESFTLVAAILAAALLAFLVVRSPRNRFTFLLMAMVGSVAEWNYFEWLRWSGHGWAMAVQFVGIAFLPAFALHFATTAVGTFRLRAARTAGYAAAGTFAFIALGSLVGEDFRDYFHSAHYNVAYVGVEGPILVLSAGVLAYGAFAGPPEVRGVLRFVLLAVVVAGALGILDLLRAAGIETPSALGNLGAVVGCALLTIGAWNHRELFDSLSILREETARLLSSTRYGIVSFDPSGTVVFSNDPAVRILGAPPRSREDVDAILPGLGQAEGVRYFRHRGGVILATLLPVRSRFGVEARQHLLLEERTVEVRRLGDLAQRESLASLGEAAATMAHEIRNSLTALGTTLDTLSREEHPDPEALRGLHEEVDRLGGVLAKSLSLAGSLPLDRQGVDLGRLLRKVAGAAPGPPAVEVETEEGLPEVHADPDLLGQVFRNLLRNAAEAGAREVRVEIRREGREAAVRIRNDGPPLPEAVLSRLFEPFVTSRAGGTGLGLALCRKIATAHGGRISGRNVGGGVEFEVRLPWTS